MFPGRKWLKYENKQKKEKKKKTYKFKGIEYG